MPPLDYIRHVVYQATLLQLPARMDSHAARAMLTAIGMQESRLRHRRQQDNGPARGFWQFETAGVRGVLQHGASRPYLLPILAAMHYDQEVTTSYAAVEHNDILACIYARLLLWTHTAPLPAKGEHEAAWQYYLSLWRPGRPHRDTWNPFFDRAWEVVTA